MKPAPRIRPSHSPHPRGFLAALAPLVILLPGLGFGPPQAQARPPKGQVLVSIEGISGQGLQREVFALAGSTALHVRSEGLADPKGEVFLAQGWILDLETRKPVWALSRAGGSWSKKTHNWSAEGDLTLPAGVYAAYFAAYGGQFPLDAELRVLGLSIGRIEANKGPVIVWNKKGQPSRWGLEVRAVDPGFTPLPAPADLPGPYPAAMIRLVDLPDAVLKRVQIDLSRPVTFDVHFTGEYSFRGKEFTNFADGAWIVARGNWQRIWSPDYSSTDPAGGAEKNRAFAGTIRMPAGSYLLTAATDNSHAAGEWNEPPPWDPDAWGIAMTPQEEADRSAIRLTPNAGLPEPVVSINQVGDDAFIRKPFTVKRPVHALIRCLGEGTKGKAFSDFGWIESLTDLQPVWHMRNQETFPGGGAAKNRLAEAAVDLAPGGYALCYTTDDSHSFEDWNQDPPWEPEAWGITVSLLPGAGEGERRGGSGAILPGEPEDAPTVLSLAPMGSGQRRIKEFDIVEPARVLVVALGECSDDEFADYGWLVNEGTGEKIWEMKYRDSEPAGGAKKNREIRTHLRLPKGTYSLHYVTDDSHAFGDWNDRAPDQPELWGVTLVELP